MNFNILQFEQGIKQPNRWNTLINYTYQNGDRDINLPCWRETYIEPEQVLNTDGYLQIIKLALSHIRSSQQSWQWRYKYATTHTRTALNGITIYRTGVSQCLVYLFRHFHALCDKREGYDVKSHALMRRADSIRLIIMRLVVKYKAAPSSVRPIHGRLH